MIQRFKKRTSAFSTISVIKEDHLIYNIMILLRLVRIKSNNVGMIKVYRFGERQELYRFCFFMINPCDRMQSHYTQQ